MSTRSGAKVFGIGWAKTGTTTLGTSLRTLGFDHCTTRLDLVLPATSGDLGPVLAVAEQHESFDDWPWPLVYAELDAAFPDSRFVLTTREPARWLASYRNMVGRQPPPSEELAAVRRAIYGTDPEQLSDEELLGVVAGHDAAVRRHFAHRPDALLVVDWEGGAGWDELCSFLGRPVPDRPFPHENRGAYTPADERDPTSGAEQSGLLGRWRHRRPR
ncbi:MAG: sulfotransferase family protein [Acidimicrobiia bacterium]|nr:sulfotransferase family protein [Acidimicrobiia bacterium]